MKIIIAAVLAVVPHTTQLLRRMKQKETETKMARYPLEKRSAMRRRNEKKENQELMQIIVTVATETTTVKAKIHHGTIAGARGTTKMIKTNNMTATDQMKNPVAALGTTHEINVVHRAIVLATGNIVKIVQKNALTNEVGHKIGAHHHTGVRTVAIEAEVVTERDSKQCVYF